MALVHPRFLAGVAILFSDTCTIREPVRTNAKGDVTTAWDNVAGMENIPCRVSPVDRGREVRLPEMTYAVTTHYITLQGRYDAIEPHYQAVVGGVEYDIEGIIGDGSDTMTRLAVRVVTA